MSYTAKSWSETKADLRTCMERWGVREWDIECESTRYSSYGLDEHQRRVLVWYLRPTTGEEKRLETAQFDRPMDNLRAIYLTIDGIRLAERRGLGELMRQAFSALPAPARERDPYEILGVRPDASPEVIQAAYRTLARSLHSDVGGSDEAMTELNKAYEAVKR